MKRTQPRYFKSVPRAGGRRTFKWEPNKALRDAGWKPLMLGDDLAAAVARAEARNAEVDAWRLGARPDAMPQLAPVDNRHATMGDLIDRYTREELPSKAAKTQAEYRSRMKAIRAWADNGRVKLRFIDRDQVETYRDALLTGDTAANAAGILRVLSVLMGWAETKRMIPRGTDPAKRLRIPEPASRKKRIQPETVEAIAAADPHVALAVRMGFYMVQRPGDLRALTAFHWRQTLDIAAHDRAILAGADGQVWSFRFKQHKTGAWVDLAVAQDIRAGVEAALAANAAAGTGVTHILIDPATGRPWHERQFTRRIRNAITTAREAAAKTGDEFLVDQLTGLQFRDLRRSGMCWMRDLGVPVPLIAARSGHSIQVTQKILDTYMPADSRGSAAAIAMATSRQAERTAEQKDKQG